MKHPILQTKLQRPRVASDILPRNRLFDILERGRKRTLTLISAPAGYGKSTLASRWAEACDLPCGWVSLDEGDRDPRMFLSYFMAAIRSLFPHMEFKTEALLEASPLPSATILASHLLNDLHTVSEPFVLVLDDYQNIRRTSVNDFLSQFLAYPPETMHLVILTRRDPALPIARLRGRGMATEIRAADLRFTSAETAEFLNKMLEVTLDDATAVILEKKVEGWAAGLRLTGLYLKGNENPEERVLGLCGSSRHIAEYLVEEVLSRQKPEIAQYLLETSILERFSAPLCQAVHSRGPEGQKEGLALDAQRFVDWLVEANIFVVPLDDLGYWFRYHHLFRDFLRALFRKQESPEKIAELYMAACDWFAENDLIDEAIQYALAAGNTRVAVRLILDHRHGLMNNSEFFRLKRWLNLLPADTVAENPLLASTLAYIGIEWGKDDDVYFYTNLAERMLAGLSPESEEYAILKSEVYVLKGFIEMALGRTKSGIALVGEALDPISFPPRALLVRSLGIFALTACRQMEGNLGLALEAFEEALSNPGWPVNLRARLHFYFSATCYMDADLDRAISYSRECLKVLRNYPFIHTKMFACCLLGTAGYLRNQLTEAETHLKEVLDNWHLSNPSYLANAGFLLSCIYLSRDSAAKAEEVLARIDSHFQETGHAKMQTMCRCFQAEFALRRGDIQRAVRLSENVDFDIRPPLWFFYVPQLTPIKVMLAEGTEESLKNARARLVELDEKMRGINRKSVRIDILALLALAYRKSGEEQAAAQTLRTSLDLAEPGGFVRNFVDLGCPLKELLEDLGLISANENHARRVFEACKAQTESAPPSAPAAGSKPPLSEENPVSFLTQREMELIYLLEDGMSNKEIARELHISVETVKTHLQNIYRKLDVKSRLRALKEVRKMDLFRGIAREPRAKGAE